MATITISRQYGSGGDEIADRVCQALGYRHFDKWQIARAAAEAGLSEKEILSYASYSEETFKFKKFLDRLLRRKSSPSQPHAQKLSDIGMLISEERVFDEAAAVMLVQRAIKAAREAGNIMIVGRGGQVILKNQPDVLHVRIEAPMEDRIQRVKGRIKEERRAYYADIEVRRSAQELIAERDAASADYIRQFYCVDWADPFLYHILLNTGKLKLDEAAQIIVDTVHCLYA